MYTTQYLHPSFFPHPSSLALQFDGLPQHARVPFHHGVFSHALPTPSSNALWNPAAVSLSAEDTESGRDVAIDLENKDSWERFAALGTEMIITKGGRRAFPYAKIKVSGLSAKEHYLVGINVVRVDNRRYKFSNSAWQDNGEGERIDRRMEATTVFFHQDGPLPGDQVIAKSFNFQKVKLTNNTNHRPRDQHVFHLHSGHKYRLQFLVCRVMPVQYGFVQPPPVPVKAVIAPVTEFIAVTAYQNEKVTALKIELNPFAKGFRENGGGRKRKRNPTSDDTEYEESKRAIPSSNDGDEGAEEEDEDEEDEEKQEEESCSSDVVKAKSTDRVDTAGCDSGVECCCTPNSVAGPEDSLRTLPISPCCPTQASPAPALKRSDSLDSGQENLEKTDDKIDLIYDQSSSKEAAAVAGPRESCQSLSEVPSSSSPEVPSKGGKAEEEPKPKTSPGVEPSGQSRETPSREFTNGASQKRGPQRTSSDRNSYDASSPPTLQLDAVSPAPSSASPRDCPSRDSSSRSSQEDRRSVSLSDRQARDAAATHEIHRIAAQEFDRRRDIASHMQSFSGLFSSPVPVSVPISMAQYSCRDLASLHMPAGYLSSYSDDSALLPSSFRLPTSMSSMTPLSFWSFPSAHYGLSEAVTSSQAMDALQRYSYGLAERRLPEESLQLVGNRVGAVNARLAAHPYAPHSPPIRRPVPVWPSLSGVPEFLPRSHPVSTPQLPHVSLNATADHDYLLRLQQDIARHGVAAYRPLQLGGHESSCDSVMSTEDQERVSATSGLGVRCWTLPDGRQSVLSTPPQDRSNAPRDS